MTSVTHIVSSVIGMKALNKAFTAPAAKLTECFIHAMYFPFRRKVCMYVHMLGLPLLRTCTSTCAEPDLIPHHCYLYLYPSKERIPSSADPVHYTSGANKHPPSTRLTTRNCICNFKICRQIPCASFDTISSSPRFRARYIHAK